MFSKPNKMVAKVQRLDYRVKIVLGNIEKLEMNIADLKEDWAFTKVEMDLKEVERMEHQRQHRHILAENKRT